MGAQIPLREGDGTYYSARPNSRANSLAANMDRRAHETLAGARHSVASRARILRNQTVGAKQADPAAHLPGSPAPFRGVFRSRTVQPFGHLTIAKAAHGVFTPQHGPKQGLIVA